MQGMGMENNVKFRQTCEAEIQQALRNPRDKTEQQSNWDSPSVGRTQAETFTSSSFRAHKKFRKESNKQPNSSQTNNLNALSFHHFPSFRDMALSHFVYGITSFLVGSASPGDVSVPDSITVQLLCLGRSSLVRYQPPPQAAPRVCSMFESRNSAAPFSPQSNAVFWLKSLKAPRENKVIPIRTSPHFIYFGILPGTVPFAALSLPLVFHRMPHIPAISAVTPAP